MLNEEGWTKSFAIARTKVSSAILAFALTELFGGNDLGCFDGPIATGVIAGIGADGAAASSLAADTSVVVLASIGPEVGAGATGVDLTGSMAGSNGGNGLQSSITGTATYYAGGGGGGAEASSS